MPGGGNRGAAASYAEEDVGHRGGGGGDGHGEGGVSPHLKRTISCPMFTLPMGKIAQRGALAGLSQPPRCPLEPPLPPVPSGKT